MQARREAAANRERMWKPLRGYLTKRIDAL
jgi:hypothetical protein